MINIREIKKKRDNIAVLQSITWSLQMISSTKRSQYLKKSGFLEAIEENFDRFCPDFSVFDPDSKKRLYIVLSCDQRFCKSFLNLLNKRVAELKLTEDDHLIVFGRYSFKVASTICATFEQYKVISNFHECELVAEKMMNGYSKVFICSYIEESNLFELTNITKQETSLGVEKIASEGFLKTYLATKLYRLFLNSGIKEESDRSLAMSEASENAKNLTKELDRQKNQMRQGQITKEITSV